jgi:hypothetical protein
MFWNGNFGLNIQMSTGTAAIRLSVM